MSDDDFYCELCEDTGYVEVQEGEYKPCPRCNKKKKKERELDD